MKEHFDAVLELIRKPLPAGGVKTDNSALLVYPPERELDFREQLLDGFIPQLIAQKFPHLLLDLSGFLFECLDEKTIPGLQEEEFDNYRLLIQGLAKRVESRITKRLRECASEVPGGAVFVYATVALFPLVRFADILRELRDLHCRIVIAFPGGERGGKLHFMNRPDGDNYLAVQIT